MVAIVHTPASPVYRSTIGLVTAPTPNLLDGLSWTAGASTTLSIGNNRARATRAGANPRIYKHITTLRVGATYRLRGNVWKGTANGVVLRVSDTTAGGTDGPYSSSPDGSGTRDTFFNVTFVADAADQYVHLIGVANINGQYVEIDEDMALEYVSG